MTVSRRTILLECGLSPGDVAILTATIRDRHRSDPGGVRVKVKTSAPQLWDISLLFHRCRPAGKCDNITIIGDAYLINGICPNRGF